MAVSDVLAHAGARVVDEVRRTYVAEGPFSTVSVDVGRAKEGAPHEVELRWRAALEELRGGGAPAVHLDLLDGTSGEVTPLAGEVRRTVVVGAEGVLLDVQHQSAAPRPTQAETGPLPGLVPLLHDAGAWVPYLLVEVGRTVAALHLRVNESQGEWAQALKGEDEHARKVHAGGWSDRRWQVHVEEVWRGNAGQVVDEAVAVVRATHVPLVLVSGDLRVRPDVVEGISRHVDAEVVEVDLHTLPPGTSQVGLDEDLRDALVRLGSEHVDQALTTIRQGNGRSGAVGCDQVVDCLVDGQVDTLLLKPDQLDLTVLVALRDAPYLGSPRASSSLGIAAASDVLARAALLTDAEVLVVDEDMPELQDGVAASLRWDRDLTRRH